jgi:shikimate kinase
MTPSRKYSDFQCDRTVVLVGMMGAGKTTVGRRLAPRIGLPFHDADAEIEKAAGMSVSDLFTNHGEAEFRQGEARVIKRLLEGPPHVLATGGGALLNPDTRSIIKEKAVSIWIKADLDTILRRATRRGGRPLLKSGNPREILTKLLDERRDYYAQADIHIDSQPGPHVNTVNLIIELLGDYLGVSSETAGAAK